MKEKISITRYTSSPDSMKDAIARCDGFSGLKASDKVLIKPNLVAWDDMYPIAPYGVFTTTRLMEDLIIRLKDHGCSDITVGEGSVEIKKGVGTMQAFEGLGYGALVKRYGIKLVDFNRSASEKFKFHEDLSLQIAKEAVDSDFVIDFPVLKTHGQTKVSLAIKNLKGCLKVVSKKLCHHADLDLEYCFSHIADFVKPKLTIIDGIYALERGALHFGNAFRKNVIIASKDILAADMAAAQLMGYSSDEITHFVYYAKRHNQSLSLDDYEITGEKLEDHVQPLKWDWAWTEDNTGPMLFKKMGVTGAALPKYDDSLCSGCSPLANMCNILVLSAFKGHPLPKVEILNGKKMRPRPGYEKTVLVGNCMIKANKDSSEIAHAVHVKGCPPSYQDIVAALKSAGLDINELAYIGYMKQQSEKYNGKEGYDNSFFTSQP